MPQKLDTLKTEDNHVVQIRFRSQHSSVENDWVDQDLQSEVRYTVITVFVSIYVLRWATVSTLVEQSWAQTMEKAQKIDQHRVLH